MHAVFSRPVTSFSGGCSSGLELSAAASPGCFVDRLISVGTENLESFPVV